MPRSFETMLEQEHARFQIISTLFDWNDSIGCEGLPVLYKIVSFDNTASYKFSFLHHGVVWQEAVIFVRFLKD